MFAQHCLYGNMGNKNSSSSKENTLNFWQKALDSIKFFWFREPKIIFQEGEKEWQGKWFADGETNACYNCLDIHVENGNGNRIAIIHVDHEGEEIERLSYGSLLEKVERFAGLLLKAGATKGDRIMILLPDVPEAIIAMLGCARIGAIHVVVFATLNVIQIATRIDHLEPKIIVTSSCRFARGRTIKLKPILDEAIEIATFKPKAVFVHQRENNEAELKPSRDWNLHQEMKTVEPEKCAILKATDILCINYTSGTTGPLKGIMKDHGGHSVAAKWFMKEVMGLRQGETFLSTVKMGGLASHTLQTYGVLLNGGTTIIYESAVLFEDDTEIFLRILDRYEVSIAFTLFYKLRIMKNKEHEVLLYRKKFPMKRLRAIFTGGECVDKEIIEWLTENLHVPIMSQWGQTETSIAAISYSAELGLFPSTSNYSCSGKELPGWNIKILHEDSHEECKNNEHGRMLLQLPLPPGSLVGVFKNNEIFNKYFMEFEGFYDTSDIAMKDNNGFVTVMDRADSLINVGSIKVSPSEVEQVISRHPLVTDQCIVGKENCITGYELVGFLVLSEETTFEQFCTVCEQVKRMAHDALGEHICLQTCIQVPKIPKTKTGKNQRKLLQNILNNHLEKVSREDAAVIKEIKKAFEDCNKNIQDFV